MGKTSMKSWHSFNRLLVLLFVGSVYGCQSASAITRSEVISRAQSWVSIPVLYSQISYYDGYRQDCSGYVSYCWATTSAGNPISYNTSTLSSVSYSISQNDLKQGDILVNNGGGHPGSEFAHTVIFDHWSNSSHTSYWIYEQGPDKTYYHEIPFPYYSNYDPGDYAPRRFQNIEEGGVLDPTNVYVSLTGSDASNGSSGTPFRTIKHAIDAASATQGVTIHISPGTYGEKIGTSKHILFVVNGSGAVRTGG